MPKVEIYNLRPLGWESDPEDEFFRLSTLDYCVGQVFNNFALFFKLPDGTDKDEIVSVLKRGLEVTLSQCRQLCGILENAPNGDGLCFHKKRESTVEFHIQHLKEEEEGDKYPTFDDLEAQHFVSRSLGNLDTWCVPPMTYGEKPEAHPSANPKASAFKATFIRGGLVFMMHHHHYANDVMGWAGELNQLADNCAAIFRDPSNPSLPDWDPACLDLSRVTAPTPPEAEMVDGPVSPLRHPDHKPAEWLLFHLPKSKAAKLKAALAGFPPPLPPTDDGPGGGGGQPGWISTYDAFTALICRTLTKHRLKIFSGTDTSSSPFLFGEAIDMRRRFLHQPPNNIQFSSDDGDGDGGHRQVQSQSQSQCQGQTQVQTTTAVPQRMQGNVLFVALSSSPRSTSSTQPLMTIEQVARSAPLSALARYVRGLTDSVTEEGLSAALSEIAKVKDKTSLFLRTDSFPPLSCFVTDWRDARPCEADFGFARPRAMRFPFGTVTAGLVVVYPPQGRRARSVRGSPGGEEDENDDDDEGSEFSIAVEKEIKEELLGDEEWKRWFEFRGIDGVEGVLR